MIEVEHQHRDRLVPFCLPFAESLGGLDKCAAVENPGKMVGRGRGAIDMLLLAGGPPSSLLWSCGVSGSILWLGFAQIPGMTKMVTI
jgi:hypothetical protein